MRASIPSTALHRVGSGIAAVALVVSLWFTLGLLVPQPETLVRFPDAGMQVADPGNGPGHTG
jgi:hypothetical protein